MSLTLSSIALRAYAIAYHICTMADPDAPKPAPRPLSPATACPMPNDKMLCERCGAEMYRMHAVWRCSSCNFKTDCCGW